MSTYASNLAGNPNPSFWQCKYEPAGPGKTLGLTMWVGLCTLQDLVGLSKELSCEAGRVHFMLGLILKYCLYLIFLFISKCNTYPSLP